MPTRALDEQRQKLPGTVVHAVPTHGKGFLPMGSITGDETAAATDAGVVKQKIDVVGRLIGDNGGTKILHLRLARDVGEEGGYTGVLWGSRAAQPVSFRHVFFANVAHGHVGALAGQGQRQLPSHTRAAARHYGDFTLYVGHPSRPLANRLSDHYA